jgi:hypothetical protein
VEDCALKLSGWGEDVGSDGVSPASDICQTSSDLSGQRLRASRRSARLTRAIHAVPEEGTELQSYPPK